MLTVTSALHQSVRADMYEPSMSTDSVAAPGTRGPTLTADMSAGVTVTRQPSKESGGRAYLSVGTFHVSRCEILYFIRYSMSRLSGYCDGPLDPSAVRHLTANTE